MNLIAFCNQRGIPLKREGSEYILQAADSCYISIAEPWRWYRHSTGQGGKAIDFCVMYLGMRFEDAVDALLGDASIYIPPPPPPPPQELIELHITAAPKQSRVIAYLVKTRHISYDTVIRAIKECGIVQDAASGNAVFPICDDSGKVISAELVGTSSERRFKNIPQSTGCYGFKWSIGREIRSICLFESAIDLLSFVDYYTHIDRNKPLTDVLLVSTAGVGKTAAYKHYAQMYPNAQVTACTDRDQAGADFAAREHLRHYPPPLIDGVAVKDWNDVLGLLRGRGVDRGGDS